MKKERLIKSEDIHFDFDWDYSVTIEKIKSDLIQLEQLGATHVCISSDSSYDSCSIEISATSERLESDEEYNERILAYQNKIEIDDELLRIRELNELKRLKKSIRINQHYHTMQNTTPLHITDSLARSLGNIPYNGPSSSGPSYYPNTGADPMDAFQGSFLATDNKGQYNFIIEKIGPGMGYMTNFQRNLIIPVYASSNKNHGILYSDWTFQKSGERAILFQAYLFKDSLYMSGAVYPFGPFVNGRYSIIAKRGI